MREAVIADGVPDAIAEQNGQPIMTEHFADNAFAYASIQLMQPGARDDGWHTDGGCSLLHAAVTIFGTRSVQVRIPGVLGAHDGASPSSTASCGRVATLEQKPGSFYMGTLSSLEHNVHRHASADCQDCFATHHELQQRVDDSRLQFAVMIRSDIFRECRARRIDATPGPKEFFNVVNHVVADHLARVPVALPDLTEVLDEMRWPASTEVVGLSD